MDKYEKEPKPLGEGTYAIVYRGREKASGRQVALKRIKLGDYQKDGVTFAAIRELKLLQELHHPNVMQLMDVFVHRQSIYCVNELGVTDLEHVIRDKTVTFSEADIKSFMRMLLEGVAFLHANWVLHRDLKPNNLLLGMDDFAIKIADFGLARQFAGDEDRLSPDVVTRWYKPPELFFGCNQYGFGVDMWSVGCIFAELMLRKPLFPGDREMEQLALIFKVLGTPNEENWPGVTLFPDFVEFETTDPQPWDKVLPAGTSPLAIDLLARFLALDPNRRCTASEALEHPYFSTRPDPTPPKSLPVSKRAFFKGLLVSSSAGRGVGGDASSSSVVVSVSRAAAASQEGEEEERVTANLEGGGGGEEQEQEEGRAPVGGEGSNGNTSSQESFAAAARSLSFD